MEYSNCFFKACKIQLVLRIPFSVENMFFCASKRKYLFMFVAIYQQKFVLKIKAKPNAYEFFILLCRWTIISMYVIFYGKYNKIMLNTIHKF